jgi:hypothetical protein
MKALIILVLVTFVTIPVFTQVTISGQSAPTKLTLTPEYKRGLPPILYANMSFADANNNNILEANESSTLTIEISNQGKGPAQSVNVTVTDLSHDPALIIGKSQTIAFIYPDHKVRVTIPIRATMDISSGQKKLVINIRENFGYDMDPAYLLLNTLEFREPRLVFAGLSIIDNGPGTVAIQEDGKLQAGEQVKVKIMIQNVGHGTSVKTRFSVKSEDPNIYIENGEGEAGDLTIGDVKDIWISLSPNKRVITTTNLPVFLTLSNEVDRGCLKNFQLPLSLEQKPPDPVIIKVNPDIDKLTREVTRFEVTSPKITTSFANIIGIRQISPSKTKRKNAVAILIGIEHYDHFVPAPYAENDATVLADYFKNELGIDKVYIYRSKEASGYFFDNIFNPEIGELQKAVEKGVTDLFVFYSGHGIPSKDGTKVYLMPSDARIEAIEHQGYDINNFYDNLKSLKARSVTVIMDACFSGVSKSSEAYKAENLVAMKGIKIRPVVGQPWETDPNFTVFSSSGFDQTSLAFDPSETGLFTYFLCAGLQGKADLNGDNIVTSGELEQYVTAKVQETSVKISGLQVPQFHGDRQIPLVEFITDK